MNYEIIYKAASSYEAYFIKGLLSKYSIDSILIGENLSIGVGELPVDVLHVKVLVHKSYYNESKKIISGYKYNYLSQIDEKDWKCSFCGNSNPSSFEICWNCIE